MKRVGGFTLIELMVTISVASILLAVAVPSLTSLVRSNQTSSDANALLSLVLLARSEAVKRGTRVVACKSADGETCSTDATVGWDDGVIVFADDDDDATIDTGETIIRTVFPLASVSQITGSADALRYEPNGRGRPNTTLNIQSGDSKSDRKLIISPAGRPRVEDA